MVRFDSNAVTVLLNEEQFDEVVAAVVTEIGFSSLATEIADPGDGMAIEATTHGHVPLEGGATAETRTLAAPAFVGQELMLTADSIEAEGSIAIDCGATPINADGDQIVTFDATMQTIHLRAVAGPNWRLLVNDGCTLAPGE